VKVKPPRKGTPPGHYRVEREAIENPAKGKPGAVANMRMAGLIPPQR